VAEAEKQWTIQLSVSDRTTEDEEAGGGTASSSVTLIARYYPVG